MKLREIMCESIDQQAADELLRGLVASGDPSAPYFQMTRYDTRHSSIDSAQRAAERMYNKVSSELKKVKNTPVKPTTAAPAPTAKVKQPTARPAADSSAETPYGDRFYGNQYTGSLGRSNARYEPGELGRLLGIKPKSAIGRALGTVTSAAKPLDDLKRAFQLGTSFASRRR